MGIAGGALFGGLFFLWIAGTRIINPAQFGWLMKLDWRINFLGWHLFRNDPWRIPPGIIEGYLAGEGTTIGFTDSVPLAALLLKPFDTALPTPFQYFGLWLLLCFVLQGAFGALITRVYTSSRVLQAAGGAVFVLLPTLLMRVGHPALTAHFLLLAAIYLYVASAAHRPSSGRAQAVLGFIAALIHPYLAAMTLAILVSLPLRDRTRRSVVMFAGAVTATIVGWWIAGFISVSNTTDLSAGGLGLYSMNLLSPMTPRGWSTLLPELPVAHELQAYEGFQYFGVGTIGLLIVAATMALFARPVSLGQMAPLCVVALVCALYSLSPRITVGASVLVDWSNPTIDRLAFFRASGRFFWPLTYVLLSGAIAVVVARLRWTVAALVLVLAIVFQFIDQRNAHAERRATSRSEAFHTWPRQLLSNKWHEILPHYDHMVLAPASQCGGAPLEHEELAYLAGLHNLTINSGLGARWDESSRRRYCGGLEAAIAAGQVDDRSIYIVSPAHEQQLRVSQRPVVCGTLDVARVCVTEASYQAWRDSSPLSE